GVWRSIWGILEICPRIPLLAYIESLYEDDDGNSTYNNYQLDDTIIANVTSNDSWTANLLTDFNTYRNSEEQSDLLSFGIE
ncbi:19468_t:CDS:1, partial [Funneliformis geosporum]